MLQQIATPAQKSVPRESIIAENTAVAGMVASVPKAVAAQQCVSLRSLSGLDLG